MIALIALCAESPPSLAALEGCIRRIVPAESSVALAPGHLEGRVGDVAFRIARVEEPIPFQLLEGPCVSAWHWPEAAATFEPHRSQLTVIVEGEKDLVLHQSLFLTRLVAELAQSFSAVGIYWDNAPMVHPPDAFCEAAQKMSLSHLPLRLWVDFRLIPEESGGNSLATFGLSALGLKEIEVVGCRRDPPEILRWAYNLAHYLLEGGTVEDDQTIGIDEEERILVRLELSMFEAERTVHVLKL